MANWVRSAVVCVLAALGTAAAQTEEPHTLDRQVTDIRVPRLPFWRAPQELVRQLEVPAGISLGQLPGDCVPYGVPRMRLSPPGYVDLRLNPEMREWLIGPTKVRQGSIRSVLDSFCRDGRIFEWSLRDGVVLIRRSDPKKRPRGLSTAVSSVRVDCNSANAGALGNAVLVSGYLEHIVRLMDKREFPNVLCMLNSEGLLPEDPVAAFCPRTHLGEWQEPLDLRAETLEDVLTHVVRTAPHGNGVWLSYELSLPPGARAPQAEVRPRLTNLFTRWSTARRRLCIDQLVGEMAELGRKD